MSNRQNRLAIYLTDQDKARLENLAHADVRSLSMEGLLLLRYAMDQRENNQQG